MAPRLLWMAKILIRALLCVIAGYVLSALLGYQQTNEVVEKVNFDTIEEYKTRVNTDVVKQVIDNGTFQENKHIFHADVESASPSSLTPTNISESDLRKMLNDICDRVGLTLENPEDGPGEFGRATEYKKENLTIAEQRKWERGYTYSGYNMFVSDKIALRRRMRDRRHALCHNVTYPDDLPQASVIIAYHKEALSALMRCVLSTIDRAPPHLLKEVILVDDFSEDETLLGPLDEFASVLPKVRVLRNSKREGLMRTRMRGIMLASAPVVVIKDAHTEYSEGWLEPLLAEIAADPTTIAQSLVESMDMNTFRIPGASPENVHTFDFRLMQQIYHYPAEALKGRTSPIDPVISPAMLGTEFAVDKAFFLKLGGYDPGLEVWGAEEMEMSFKSWMCGGSMVVIPCSRVAHLFRMANHRKLETYVRNIFRVAAVWMDEYKYEVFQRYGNYPVS